MASINNELQSVAQFDIVEFAKQILNEVDQIRSYEFKQADDNTSSKEHKPIESRTNVFFRLVGLPMFISINPKDEKNAPQNNLSGIRSLTPGYFGGKFASYVLENTDEVSSELEERELMLLSRENQIGSKEMNEAMTLALKYAIPLSPDVNGIVGPSGIPFNYSGAEPISGQRKVFKKLFPLITSYIKVSPVKNETARLFLQYTKDQMPDSQTVLTKPLIETVIRIRLISAANAENTAGKNKISDIKDAIKATIGSSSYTEISDSTDSILSSVESGGILENLILRRLLSSLPQLAKRWNDLQKRQEYLRQKGNYTVLIKTSSAQNNPFGKRTDISANLILDPTSEDGRKLTKLQIKLAKEQAMQMLLPSDDTIFGNSTGGTTKNTVLTSLIAPLSKLLSPDLEQTQKEIKRIEENVKKNGQLMESLRLELEVMTGEFTGLSIIDVVSLIIALFTISTEDLIALLDTDVKNEMKKDSVLKTAIENAGNPDGLGAAQTAVANLEKSVKWVFDLLNVLIKVNINKSSRPKDASNNPQKSNQLVNFNEMELSEET